MPVALLAEDDPQSAAAWTGVLRLNGWEVVWAPDGAAALLLARQARPDLLITDFDMPKMDGLSLCLAFRTDSALANVPIILASANPSAVEKNATAHDSFLQKPVNAFTLLAAIAAITIPRRPPDVTGSKSEPV
ncbi:response regulator transcription factor [Caballeronia catudaia]|uniref:response regulator transcription factor n=1 Tax=Caballeronia catudaia TaxID=1777136 RepID=UPI001F2D0F60|nr:response regulator [Caballeronia catudaia]